MLFTARQFVGLDKQHLDRGAVTAAHHRASLPVAAITACDNTTDCQLASADAAFRAAIFGQKFGDKLTLTVFDLLE